MDQRRPFFLFPSVPCRMDCFASSSWIKQVFAFLLHRVNQHFGFTHILLVFLFQLLRGSTVRIEFAFQALSVHMPLLAHPSVLFPCLLQLTTQSFSDVFPGSDVGCVVASTQADSRRGPRPGQLLRVTWNRSVSISR